MPFREGEMPNRAERPVFDALSRGNFDGDDWAKGLKRPSSEDILELGRQVPWPSAQPHDECRQSRVSAYVAADLVAYIRKGLSNKVLRKLQKAFKSRSQRAELLRRLFADVALDIDLRAQGVLSSTGSYQFLNRSPSPPPRSAGVSHDDCCPRVSGRVEDDVGTSPSHRPGRSGRANGFGTRTRRPSAGRVQLEDDETDTSRGMPSPDEGVGPDGQTNSTTSSSSRSSCLGAGDAEEAEVSFSGEEMRHVDHAEEEAAEDGQFQYRRGTGRGGRSTSVHRALTEAFVGEKAAGAEDKWCFYEVLAAAYEAHPEQAEELLPLFAPLWSSPFCSQVFTLLLHRWLFTFPSIPAHDLLRFTRAFITGCDSIFGIDILSNNNRFAPLFEFVLSSVVMNKERYSQVPQPCQKDLFCLVARFLFFYDGESRLHALLQAVAKVEALHSAAADVFVMEVTNQLHLIKVEPVLRLYLQRCADLRGVVLGPVAATRLQVALFSFASPGGPLFPTPAVRVAARQALDTICPVGRWFRYMVSLLFRLLHPLFWPASLLAIIQASLLLLYLPFLEVWRLLTGSQITAKKDT